MMPSAPTFILAGGGTGGHLTPGLAVAEALRRLSPGCRIVFAGGDRPIDQLLLAREERRILPSEPLRNIWRHPWRFMVAHGRAWRLAKEMVAELSPRSVCGLGGITSLPPIYAAHRVKIPTFALEQNVVPGRANRFLSKSIGAICTSFAETQPLLPPNVSIVQTGNPVRGDIAKLTASPSKPIHRRTTVLVLGGSQGAQPLNDAILALLANAPPEFKKFRWVHQAGPNRTGPKSRAAPSASGQEISDASAILSQAYKQAGVSAEVAPFFNDLDSRLPNAALAITRAGATTLAELACAATPAVLIPYPQATDRHQEVNALYYAAGGAALIVPQEPDLNQFASQLADTLRPLLLDPGRLQHLSDAMRLLAIPGAADEVARLLMR